MADTGSSFFLEKEKPRNLETLDFEEGRGVEEGRGGGISSTGVTGIEDPEREDSEESADGAEGLLLMTGGIGTVVEFDGITDTDADEKRFITEKRRRPNLELVVEGDGDGDRNSEV